MLALHPPQVLIKRDQAAWHPAQPAPLRRAPAGGRVRSPERTAGRTLEQYRHISASEAPSFDLLIPYNLEVSKQTRSSDFAALDVTVLAQGQPLAGSNVDGLYWIRSMKVGNVSGRTDCEGKVRLLIPAGECSLKVSANGYAGDSVETRVPGEQRIDLEPSGRICLRVMTEDFQPLVNASIKAYGASGPPFWKVEPAAAPGIYVLDGLPKRPHRVLVTCHLWQGARLDDVVPDESIRDVVLRKGSRISGRVVDVSGKGVTKAFVSGTDEAGLFVSGRADDEGRFVLQGVGDGKIAIRAIGPRLLSRWVEGVKPGTEDVVVQLDPGGDIELHFGGDDIPNEVDIELQGRSDIDGSLAFRGGFTSGVEDGIVTLGYMGGLAWGNYELEVASEGFEAQNISDVIVSSEVPISIVNLVLHRSKDTK
jgi:hypothetical protein